MHDNQELFSRREMWRLNIEDEFNKFVKDRAFVELSLRKREKLYPLRQASITIYTLMFNKLLKWTRDMGYDLLDLSAEHLLDFLEDREEDGKRVRESTVVRRQYLTIVERLYAHLKLEPNPARHACFRISHERQTLVGKDLPTAALTPQQEQAFYDALPDAPRDAENPSKGWKKRRNRAMQALMLGGGLKVVETIHLKTDNVEEPDEAGMMKVWIPKPTIRSAMDEHETLLRPPASHIVQAWVTERKALGKGEDAALPGEFLFPATTNGNPMEKTQVYRYVKETLEAAGIKVDREGGRTLRNAYAVRELAEGEEIEDVRERLGLKTDRGIETYTKVIKNTTRSRQTC